MSAPDLLSKYLLIIELRFYATL